MCGAERASANFEGRVYNCTLPTGHGGDHQDPTFKASWSEGEHTILDMRLPSILLPGTVVDVPWKDRVR